MSGMTIDEDLKDVIRLLTSEIRALREDFRPEISKARLLEIREEEDCRLQASAQRAYLKRMERERKASEARGN
tara:strand:+ start:363 stop:581 length:219 start_codon:yes stop_codon:yes gene_type:complete